MADARVPFTPLTPAALAKLLPVERLAFQLAAVEVARDENPGISTTTELVLAIQRLITEPAAEGRVPGAEVGAALIRAERLRQVAVEGYDEEHDAEHPCGELAAAARAYVLHAAGRPTLARYQWPFDGGFKPGPKPLDDLVKAGALVLAEADRIAVEIDRIVTEEAKREH